MSQLITCMGEILIDFLPIQEDARTTGFRMYPGGAPFNVAVGAARLGRPTAFAGKLATDFFGRYLRAYAEQQGVDTRFLIPAEAQSTLAFVAMEGSEPAYAFYGEGAADTLLAVDELPAALFAETGILHFGSISLLRGITPAAVLATVERLKGRALLSFDPNLRPSLVNDEPAYRALLARLFALADVVKLSAADLHWLAPGRAVADAAADLLAHGPALVVVTQGGEGVLALRGRDQWRVPTFPVQVVDTVGAGDSFSGGLLAGLGERGVTSRAALAALSAADLAATLRFAAAVAALTCTRAGADPPRRAEVDAFLAAQGGAPAGGLT
jgi:fructokinase